MDEYGASSGDSDSDEQVGNPDFQEMSLEEQFNYENPIEAFQNGRESRGPVSINASTSGDTVSKRSDSAVSNKSQSPAEKGAVGETIDIRDSIIQGSFLPVTVMALAGNFPINDYIIDGSQGAKLVHYIGTFGNVKALKTFLGKF